MSSLRRETSSILLVALWILAMLSVFAVYVGHIVIERINVLSRIEDDEELHFIAESGVKMALAQFNLNKYPSSFAALAPNCTNNPAVFRDIFLGQGNYSVSYEYHDWQVDKPETRFGFMDEESKINVNHVPPGVLSRLFQVLGMDILKADKLAAAIGDYHDADTVTDKGLAEEFYYSSSGKAGLIKNNNFEFLDELKLVSGMTPEIFDAVKDYLTVSGAGLVNINTACGIVLKALGLRDELITKLMRFRKGLDGKEGTDDDNYADDLRGFLDSMAKVVTINEEEAKELNAFLLSGLVSGRSAFFSVNCRAFLNKKNKAVSVTCVSDIRGKIYYWKERRHMAVRRIFM